MPPATASETASHRRASRAGASLLPVPAVTALSLISAANMTVVGLRQLGIIHHLPDPPLRGFNADRVTADPAARLFGFPDAPVEALSAFANVPLATLAASLEAERPSLALLLGAKTMAEAGIGWWYFNHMRRDVGAWCAYCVLQMTTNTALAAVMLPTTKRAIRRTHGRTIAAVALITAMGVLGWRIARGSTSERR